MSIMIVHYIYVTVKIYIHMMQHLLVPLLLLDS